MKLALVHLSAAACPYRLLDEAGHEIAWANDFLDAQHLRQLSPRSLRAYAYDLLHFARWFQDSSRPLSGITESTLLDYVRHQLDQQPQPTPQTVNHRLTADSLLVSLPLRTKRFPLAIPISSASIPRAVRSATAVPIAPSPSASASSNLGALSSPCLQSKWPLLDGLRSCEILALQLEDLKLADALLHVLGKGKKQRTLPLPGEILEVLQSYLRLERPLTNSPHLFVSLKGRRRGQPMTPAGLRSLFRHHRLRSEVRTANPHRFRHTFGADMVRAGMSLPALQHLMGHAQIHTTLLYVQLAPSDVWREYARAVANRSPLPSPPKI